VWGIVLRVDEVEARGEATPFGVADRVGPGGDAGEVEVGGVMEEGLEEGCCVGVDKGGGEVAYGDVAEAWRRFIL